MVPVKSMGSDAGQLKIHVPRAAVLYYAVDFDFLTAMLDIAVKVDTGLWVAEQQGRVNSIRIEVCPRTTREDV